jgi:hypothetical protein
MDRSSWAENAGFANAEMRSLLIEWLWDIRDALKLETRVVFNAVGILDRLAEQQRMAIPTLQRYGLVSLWISAKLEDQGAPCLGHFRKFLDGGASHVQLLNDEIHILRLLDGHILRRTGVSGTQQPRPPPARAYLPDSSEPEPNSSEGVPEGLQRARARLQLDEGGVSSGSSGSASMAKGKGKEAWDCLGIFCIFLGSSLTGTYIFGNKF